MNAREQTKDILLGEKEGPGARQPTVSTQKEQYLLSLTCLNVHPPSSKASNGNFKKVSFRWRAVPPSPPCTLYVLSECAFQRQEGFPFSIPSFLFVCDFRPSENPPVDPPVHVEAISLALVALSRFFEPRSAFIHYIPPIPCNLGRHAGRKRLS